MATIIIFASSLFVALVLITLKAFELRCGKKNFALSCICKLDSKSENLVSRLKLMWLQISQSVRYIVLVQTRKICKDLLEKIETRITNEFRARQNAIMMGHKEIMNKGSVSFYLKKIAEHKSNGGVGKIEESF
jgi:hypothetical protein